MQDLAVSELDARRVMPGLGGIGRVSRYLGGSKVKGSSGNAALHGAQQRARVSLIRAASGSAKGLECPENMRRPGRFSGSVPRCKLVEDQARATGPRRAPKPGEMNSREHESMRGSVE